MGLWRQITHGLRSLLRREETDRELADEVRHYLDEAEAELVASGATSEEARREVRVQYGGDLPVREEVRSYGWENAVETLYADIRLTVRRLRRSPGFTTVVVLTLGLGIGAATAIFSAVSPVLFEPLAYPEADRVLAISDRSDDGSMTFGTYRELSERSLAFEALSVFKPWQPTLTGADEPERLEGQRVSAAYFDVLGVAPALGRGFEAAADRPGGANLVLLSDGLWRRRFGSDPAVVGQAVRLDSELYTVVGVMRPAFENVTAPMAQAWSLLQYDPLVASFNSREWGRHLDMLGRLRAGVGIDEARQVLETIAEQPVPEFARPTWASMGQGLSVRRLRDVATSRARPTMLVLFGAVGLLLVIACVNVTILLIARSTRRRGELAMRAALGAGRSRLVRHLLTESLVLAGLGGAFGIAVARVALAGLVAVSPPSLPRLGAIGLDSAALGFALGLTTLVGILVGLAPALTRSEGQLHEAGREAGLGSVARSGSARRALVVTEVTLAMVLLVGAGLLVRSTQRLFSIHPGFDPSQVVVMQVYTTGLERGDTPTHRFFDQALEAVRNVPGVSSVVLTNQLPLSGDIDVYGVTLDDATRAEGAHGPAYRYAVSPGYFKTMGIRLVRGRGLERQDIAGTTRVAVVSEALARRLFQGQDPVGNRIRVGPTELSPYTVVGVVEDVKQASLETDQVEAVYLTSQQWHWADRVRWIVVQADHDLMALAPAIRRAIWSVDSNQPIVRTQSMRGLVARSQAQRRFVLVVLVAFSGFALTMAAIGLYGVLAGSVAERTREIGVRSALGASPANILTLVIRQGMVLTAIGVAIGLAGAAAASEALVTLLFDVSRLDPATYLAVATLLTVVSGVACWIPAARAARVDPLATLRAE